MSVELDSINHMDVRGIFLNDPLEYPLGASAFDLRSDTGVFRFEALGQSFCHLDIHRGVEDNLAFLPGGLNEFGRHGRGLRCTGMG